MRRIAPAALLIAVVLSCQSESRPDAAVPADAGRDVGLDTAHDAPSPRDAADAVPPRDAGPGAWVSIAGSLPSFCRLLRADHPEQLDELRIHMRPCAGRSNCERSDDLALPAGQRPIWLAVDGTYALGYLDRYQFDAWIFLTPLDGGPPIAAYRGNSAFDRPACVLGFGALAEGRLALGVSYYDVPPVAGAAFYVAEIGHAADISTPVLDDRRVFGPAGLQGLWVSSQAVVAWTPAGLLDVSTGIPIGLLDPSDRTTASGAPSGVAGTDVIWTPYGTTQHIALGHAGVPGGVRYYEPAPTNEVEVARFDGHDIAWIEGEVGSTVSDFVLWTAPFVEDPAHLAPRMVRHIDVWGESPAMGAGMWVDTRGPGLTGGPYLLTMYDLADGRSRTWEEATPEIVDIGVLRVATDQIVYRTPMSPTGEHLVRFDPRLLPYAPPADVDGGVDAGP